MIPASRVEPLTLTQFVLDSRNLSVPVLHNKRYDLSVTVRSSVFKRTSRAILVGECSVPTIVSYIVIAEALLSPGDKL